MKNSMRPFRGLISLEEARRIVFENMPAIDETETVGLHDAVGRVLAEDVIAQVDVPPYSRSAVDGYAVRAEDTYGAGRYNPVRLKVIESVHAGEVPKKTVKKGEATQIATGAMIPEGANAVVMVENTEIEGGEVLIFRPVYPDSDVSGRGEDIKKGDVVLRAGERLSPAKVGAISSLGIKEIRVFRRPQVSVIPTGDEIMAPGDELQKGKIYDINTYTLSSIVRELGADVKTYPITPDRKGDIRKAIESALPSDIILLSGGSSVGERDVIVDVLAELGDVLFHGIQLKPGKPTVCGRIIREYDGKERKALVFGMPGYPTSCLTNAYVLVAPLIKRLTGDRTPPRVEKKMMSRRIVSTLGRHQIFTVRVDGEVAHPAFKESGAITSMADADGYIEIPANVDLVEKGEMVDVTFF